MSLNDTSSLACSNESCTQQKVNFWNIVEKQKMNAKKKVITSSQNSANKSLFLCHSYTASTQTLSIIECETQNKMLVIFSQISTTNR